MFGRPEGWPGAASRVMDDPEFWTDRLRCGRPRLRFELEKRANTASFNAGYTGYFTPCGTIEDLGMHTLRVHDVPYGAVSPRLNKEMFDQDGMKLIHKDEEGKGRVSCTGWRDAAIWSCWQMIKDVII